MARRVEVGACNGVIRRALLSNGVLRNGKQAVRPGVARIKQYLKRHGEVGPGVAGSGAVLVGMGSSQARLAGAWNGAVWK